MTMMTVMTIMTMTIMTMMMIMTMTAGMQPRSLQQLAEQQHMPSWHTYWANCRPWWWCQFWRWTFYYDNESLIITLLHWTQPYSGPTKTFKLARFVCLCAQCTSELPSVPFLQLSHRKFTQPSCPGGNTEGQIPNFHLLMLMQAMMMVMIIVMMMTVMSILMVMMTIVMLMMNMWALVGAHSSV